MVFIFFASAIFQDIFMQRPFPVQFIRIVVCIFYTQVIFAKISDSLKISCTTSFPPCLLLSLSFIWTTSIHPSTSLTDTHTHTLWEEGVEVLWQLYGVPVMVYEMICRSCVTEVTFIQNSLLLLNYKSNCETTTTIRTYQC